MPDLNPLTRAHLENHLAELEAAKEREELCADEQQERLVKTLGRIGEIDQSIAALKETLGAD